MRTKIRLTDEQKNCDHIWGKSTGFIGNYVTVTCEKCNLLWDPKINNGNTKKG